MADDQRAAFEEATRGPDDEAGASANANALVRAVRAFMADPANDIAEAVNPVHVKLRGHFGLDPMRLPTTELRHDVQVEQSYQLALEHFLDQGERSSKVVGLRF